MPTFVTADGAELSYFESGPRGGTAILFLHGWQGAAAIWAPIVARLAARHRTIALDIRGFGLLAGVDIDLNVIGISGYDLQKRLFDIGLHIKTTGNCAILSPPFISDKDQIDFTVETIRTALTHRP